MLLKYDYLFGLLETNYFHVNGYELNDALENRLKSAIVYAIENYLDLVAVPYQCTGALALRRFSVTQPYGDIIAACLPLHHYGSHGNGLIKTWLLDLDETISAQINRNKGAVKSINLIITRNVGVRIACQYT